MRRVRSWLLIGSFVVAVVVLLTLTSRPSGLDPLDPTNPKPAGGQAMAKVLAAKGVPVRIVHGQDELLKAPVGPGTTLVVSSSHELVKGNTRTMLKHARRAGSIVLLQPDDVVLEALGLDLVVVGSDRRRDVFADCADPLLTGLWLATDGALWYADPDDVDDPEINDGEAAALTDASEKGRCFNDDQGGYAVWNRPATTKRPALWLVGAGDVVANERVKKRDNAAIGLRLLGEHKNVVWYVPRASDAPADARTGAAAELPRALYPGLCLGLFSLLLLLLWRGRRLGRLVFEPLPVTVKAIETTIGRGRLYRKANDRDHAATVLRRATRARLAHALRLSPETTLDQMAAIVAARSGRGLDECRALLADAPVSDDSHLATLAQGLRTLEKEVSLQ